MKTFAKDGRVVVNDTLPLLKGLTGVVTDPEYMDHVIVLPDDPQRSVMAFLPEELEFQAQSGTMISE